ncbi:MAG: DUF503 domain-containing protein [Firmicutes bacterium]|nr:DUF503 domain-containing protein [Bacillota bacterium]
MVIGVLTVEIMIGEASSLKGKRRVLKSLLDRLKSKYNISVAEVGKQDSWQLSTIGITTVSNESSHVHKVLSTVIHFIEFHGGVELIDYSTELL